LARRPHSHALSDLEDWRVGGQSRGLAESENYGYDVVAARKGAPQDTNLRELWRKGGGNDRRPLCNPGRGNCVEQLPCSRRWGGFLFLFQMGGIPKRSVTLAPVIKGKNLGSPARFPLFSGTTK